MNKKKYRKKSGLGPMFIGLAIFAAALGMAVFGFGRARSAVSDEGIRTAEESIRRAVVMCYAIENRYPESYEYVVEHYGVTVDESKYAVHYEIFAANLMPSITVVRKWI